jgi:hypothetical protein
MVKFYCPKEKRRFKLADIKSKCWSCELGHGCNAFAVVIKLTDSTDLRMARDLNFFFKSLEA